MRDLHGKTMLVTGAAGGIGMAIAGLFDREGVHLVISDIDGDGLGKTAATLTREPLCVACDITKPDQVQNMVAAALERFGAIDILMNCAGIIEPSPFESCTHKDIERQVDINLMGAINCTHAVIPVMKEAGDGHIATISSMSGIVPEMNASIYTATKFALRGLNLTLAIELKEFNIGVSTIFPDSVATPMLTYESQHAHGSSLTFLSLPMDPSLVARGALKAITKNRAEVSVPASTGLVSKLIMCWPWAVTRIWPLLAYMGERKKAAAEKVLHEKMRR